MSSEILSTLEKINETVVLPLHQLIAPSKSRRRKHIPRPQNSFILYRRNLNAIINKRNDVTSNFKSISKEAAKNWSKESNEIKQLQSVKNLAIAFHQMEYHRK
ncbi:13016_t:CDS:2 [Gigaspora margarita]|uniref:13016_t:CDS:1 n=1 Tax=Gigaspora margarita TaxID=4874 RepID=A0ABN7VMU0_GIGMA|nr:13016_t:CDS:2 [Gigaspora margarita]